MRRAHARADALAGIALAALLVASSAKAASKEATRDSVRVVKSTWVDHDKKPIAQPPEGGPDYWRQQFRQGVIDPVSHIFDIPDKLIWAADGLGADPEREAANVNAFDEAPNSSWFTNRNHMRAISPALLGQRPDEASLPAKPWVIKSGKSAGATPGFQIKDAEGKRWFVKLDPKGHPQLGAGADMIARTILHAAGYNVPHNRPIRFRRTDLTIDEELLRASTDERFTEADLESVLVKAATFPDGNYSGYASLFLEGKVLGAPNMNRRRPGDTNDWYLPFNRRELRGLYVLVSWIGNWDTKDQQFLDTFLETRDSLGHVEHYILDAGASLGAAGRGAKKPWAGYENTVDFEWTGRRLVSLGFVEEPWRGADQESGIPSVGNFESADYSPDDFKPLMVQPAFHRMTDRDGYWGAKIVASFSDEQIAAIVDAVGYEDPRAGEYLIRHLIVRRDKVARHWFGRVTPLDYFHVEEGVLRFHDLAVDIGIAGARAYDVDVQWTRRGDKGDRDVRLSGTELPLAPYGDASHLSLEFKIRGDGAKSTRVELTRMNSGWTVTRVRHG